MFSIRKNIKKITAFILMASMIILSGCGSKKVQKVPCNLPDGTYIAKFDTDSSMFHLNEICEGLCSINVVDGYGTAYIALTSTNIVNLYLGLAKDAPKNEEDWLQPKQISVVFPDGTADEVNAFEVPVNELDKEFDLALIGTKGVWYDHKVSVNSAEIISEGEYQASAELVGGSGKAHIENAIVNVAADGAMTATITWSSSKYDYMIVNGEKLLPINTEGNSVFEMPVSKIGVPLDITADTIAMSEPHEIEYTIQFDIISK